MAGLLKKNKIKKNNNKKKTEEMLMAAQDQVDRVPIKQIVTCKIPIFKCSRMV